MMDQTHRLLRDVSQHVLIRKNNMAALLYQQQCEPIACSFPDVRQTWGKYTPAIIA